MKYRLKILSVITFFAMGCSTTKTVNNGTIYKTDENRSQIYKLYDERLAEWPVPYDIIEIDTRYTRASGG